jgi:hypothetical protein
MMHTNNEAQGMLDEPIYLDESHKDGSALIENGAMRIIMDLARIMDTENNIKITTKN